MTTATARGSHVGEHMRRSSKYTASEPSIQVATAASGGGWWLLGEEEGGSSGVGGGRGEV